MFLIDSEEVWDRVVRVCRYARQSLHDVKRMTVREFLELSRATSRLLELENGPAED